MPSVFISYSRRDKDFVERLHGALGERGYEVWVDWEDIPPSAQWLEEIRGGILSADGVIYVISPDSAASQVCTTELEHAIAQHKRIVPVVCRDPAPAVVPDAAAALNWVFMRGGDDFDASLDLLVEALETDLEHVRTHTRIGVEAERWDASGRERSQLLRGAELATAEAWLVSAADRTPAPSQLQREFLLAGRQSATRRQRLVIGAVSVALAVAIVLGVLALIQRNDAQHATRVATAQGDDSIAEGSLANDPQQSVVEAIRALSIAPNDNSEEALRSALASSHLQRRFAFPADSLDPDAVWSPDGTRLLVSSPDNSATIYPLAGGGRTIHLPSSTLDGAVAWDARGDRVIIGGATTAVYAAATGRLIRKLPQDSIYVALSADGTRAAMAGVNAKSQVYGSVYDVATGRLLATFHPTFTGGVTCFAWAPNGSVIAECDTQSPSAANTSAALDLWSPVTGRLVRSQSTASFLDSVAFSPDSRRYAYTLNSGSKPGTFVDETATGVQLAAFPDGSLDAVFSPDGTQLAYAPLGNGDLADLYTFSSGNVQPLAGAGAAVDSLRFNAAGTQIVAASEDGSARVYDSTGTSDLNYGDLLETLSDGQIGAVKEASFGLGGAAIATTSDDGDARLWAAPQQPSSTVTVANASDYEPIDTASFSAGGGIVVEAGVGGGEILSPRNLRLVAWLVPPAPYNEFYGAGASRDGRIVAGLAVDYVAGRIDGAAIATYDGRTGKLLATITAPAGVALANASIAPSGTRMVTIYTNGDAAQWDPRTGRALDTLHGSGDAVLTAYSHNSSIVAVVHEPAIPAAADFHYDTTLGPVTIDLWNARTGHLIHHLVGPALTPLIPGILQFAPLGIAFSADDRLIALVGADHDVHAWKTGTGDPDQPLALPRGQFAVSVAFSPNDGLLAAGGGAGTFVWQLFSDRGPIEDPELMQANPSDYNVGVGDSGIVVGFTSNSQVLVTVGDAVLKAWNVADQLQIFDTPAVHGALDANGDEIVAATETATSAQLSLYPCRLCGGLTQLESLAKAVPGVGGVPSG